MTKKFKLGFRQRRWLKMLETTRRKQAKEKLFDGTGYCCLGLVCISERVPLPHGGKQPYLPGVIAARVKLRTPRGEAVEGRDSDALWSLNDNGKSFREIAAIIRNDPSAYFTGSA